MANDLIGVSSLVRDAVVRPTNDVMVTLSNGEPHPGWWLYRQNGEAKLVKSLAEYEQLLASGEWRDTPDWEAADKRTLIVEKHDSARNKQLAAENELLKRQQAEMQALLESQGMEVPQPVTPVSEPETAVAPPETLSFSDAETRVDSAQEEAAKQALLNRAPPSDAPPPSLPEEGAGEGEASVESSTDENVDPGIAEGQQATARKRPTRKKRR